eukprot:SAG22_NODE_8018_length_690_cov_3.294416_1_plen_87_part_01
MRVAALPGCVSAAAGRRVDTGRCRQMAAGSDRAEVARTAAEQPYGPRPLVFARSSVGLDRDDQDALPPQIATACSSNSNTLAAVEAA